ncbi:hypothetical protein [Paenibacillus hexagrammi]|uniref:Uncharacterized protein n=1 Tax=Paenibacillus hexagrammi TaxID=2908839 RepID=A0ABY3SL97_9BACL|nr:hypothetical protein [Paenibacillus sp. YPD9-1]UJF34837.1 hypothetical protein L0M14_06685 [Paenibacillus sp. YPD9-1]
MLVLSGQQDWMQKADVVGDYDNYLRCELGICDINPKDIVGLSLWPPEELFNDEYMRFLYDSVLKLGWRDSVPCDLNLELLPNGKYTVSSRGNHRAILARAMNIPRIKANVDLLIPIYFLSEKTHKQLEEFRLQQEEFEHEAAYLGKLFSSKGFISGKLDEEKNYRDLLRESNRISRIINQLLKEEGFRLNLIPKGLGVLKVKVQ